MLGFHLPLTVSNLASGFNWQDHPPMMLLAWATRLIMRIGDFEREVYVIMLVPVSKEIVIVSYDKPTR